MRALRGEQPCNQVRSRPSSVNARPQFRRFIRGGCCSCRRVQHLHDVHGLLRGRQRIRRPLRLQVHLQPQQSRVHHSATLRLQKRPLLDSRTASCGAMLPPLSLAPAPSPKGLKQHRLKKRRLKTHTEVRSRSHQSPKTPHLRHGHERGAGVLIGAVVPPRHLQQPLMHRHRLGALVQGVMLPERHGTTVRLGFYLS